ILQEPRLACLRSNRERRNKAASGQGVTDTGELSNRYTNAIDRSLHRHGVALKQNFAGRADWCAHSRGLKPTLPFIPQVRHNQQSGATKVAQMPQSFSEPRRADRHKSAWE